MTRVKRGPVAKNRRRKVLKQAKGYFGSKHRLFKTAQEQVMHSGAYAYRDRKQKKRNFRKLWITRINAAARENDISYSMFINGLNKAGIEINRKMLSEIAIDNPEYFSELVKQAKDALDGKGIVEKTFKPETKKEVKKTEVKKEVKPEVKSEVKPEVKSEVKKSPVKTDLSKLTVAELKELAKDKGLTGYSTMLKAELVSALED